MDLVPCLHECALFNHLPEDQLVPYARQCSSRTYRRDQIVYQSGLCPEFLYIVMHGRIRFDMSSGEASDNSRETTIYVASDNQYFGEIEILTNKDYYASATAARDSRLLLMPKAVFLELTQSNPTVQQQLSETLANNLRLANLTLANTILKGLEFRLAHLLLMLSRRMSEGDIASGLTLQVSQEELAQMLGTSRQSVSKHLQHFREKDWIDIRYGKISFKNYDGFKDYSRTL